MKEAVSYLDASAVVPLLVEQPTSSRIAKFLSSSPSVSLSSFSVGEATSAIARLRRMGELDAEDAAVALQTLDGLSRRDFSLLSVEDSDIRLATSFVRRSDLVLRMPDAIHIAVAHRYGHRLATFDQKLTEAARSIGIEVFTPA